MKPATGTIQVPLHAVKTEEVPTTVLDVLVKESVRAQLVEESRAILKDVFISFTGRKLRD